MRYIVLMMSCLVISAVPNVLADEETKDPVVLIADSALNDAVVKVLSRLGLDTAELTASALAKVRFLDCEGLGIESLDGLQFCTNLQNASFSDNAIVDLAPLSACVNLRTLDLSSNKINNITPLAALKRLKFLNLDRNAIDDLSAIGSAIELGFVKASHNQISDISGLGNLTALHSIYVANNQIVDVKSLAKLASLQSVDLSSNKIEDVSALQNLKQLRWTFLSNNAITDVSPLASMAVNDTSSSKSFASFWRLDLTGNPLPAESKSELQTLRQAGVTIIWKQPAAAEPEKKSETPAPDSEE